MFLQLLTLFLVSMVYGKDRCCMPDKHTVYISVLSVNPKTRQHSTFTKYVTDLTTQRFYVGQAYNSKIYNITDLTKNVAYSVSEKGCLMYDLSKRTINPVEELCVPVNATRLSVFTLGANKLSFTGYLYNRRTREGYTHSYISVDENCIPLTITSITHRRPYNYMDVIHYLNFTASIADENIFNPPAGVKCVNAETATAPGYFKMF